MNKFVRKNQVEVKFERGKEKPSREELKKWLKHVLKVTNYDIEGVQFDRLGIAIYVEFKTEDDAKDFISTTGYETQMTSDKGDVIKVYINKCDEEVKIVRLYSLPMGMDNGIIKNKLAEYGRIDSIQEERYPENDECFPGLKTGVKLVHMLLRKDIPSYIDIEGHKVIAAYNGQPKTCGNCNAQDHLRNDCPKIRKAEDRLKSFQNGQRTAALKQPLSFAEMISLNNEDIRQKQNDFFPRLAPVEQNFIAPDNLRNDALEKSPPSSDLLKQLHIGTHKEVIEMNGVEELRNQGVVQSPPSPILATKPKTKKKKSSSNGNKENEKPDLNNSELILEKMEYEGGKMTRELLDVSADEDNPPPVKLFKT